MLRLARALFAAVSLFSGFPAAAQSASGGPAGQRDADVEALIDKAVAEWTVLLTCSSFEAVTHKSVSEIWAKERSEITVQLSRLKVAPEAILRIAAKTDPAAMTAMLDKPAREVVAFCQADKEWMQRLNTFNFIFPGLKLSEMVLE